MSKKDHKKSAKIVYSGLSQQSETLLANIRFASIDEPIKTIVITSAGVDEGKTTTALALAIAMAKSGKRTLILDCDMRRRSLGKILEIHPPAGIYAVLSGQAPLKHAVVATETQNLYFLDCEPNVSNPSDLLSTKRFAALLATLRNTFDYVVIDTPPLSLFVDAAVVSSLADGVVMVVRQRSTKKRAVRNALVQLASANAHVLGLVLTFTQKGDDDYYYYYYYYYYSDENNKRVKKNGKPSPQMPVAEGENPSSKREFDEENVDNWAHRVGIDVEAVKAQEAENERRRAPARASHAARSGGHTGDLAHQTPANPFAPSAFKRRE